MRLYLSSFRLGSEPQKFSSLVKGNKRAGIIFNAHDYFPEKQRHHLLKEEIRDLQKIGIEGNEIDLRNFSGNKDELKNLIIEYDALWVPGGDCFLLRRAMYDSGFDLIIKNLLAEDKIVYAGYSAGVVVLAPSLRGLEIADDVSKVYDTYKAKIIYEGINVLPYYLIPHYKSEHGKSEAMDKVVEFFIEENKHFKTLKDGQAIVINGDTEEFLG